MFRNKHLGIREAARDFFELCRNGVRNQGLNPDDTRFIFPIGGFGELTYICSLLNALREKGPIALFLPSSREYFINLFPYSANCVLLYDPAMLPHLDELYRQSRNAPGYPFVPFTDWLGDGRFNIELVVKEGRLTLKEGYAYILELPLSTLGEFAQINPALRIAEFESPRKKRVLIIPHSVSHKPIAVEQWMRIAGAFNSRGLDVVFENSNPTLPVPDKYETVMLRVPQLLANLSLFQGVVAIRSGLADLIGCVASNQRTRMAVVYHITRDPPSEEQRAVHSTGVARSGIALNRIYPNDGSLLDFEFMGDETAPSIKPLLNFIDQTDTSVAC